MVIGEVAGISSTPRTLNASAASRCLANCLPRNPDGICITEAGKESRMKRGRLSKPQAPAFRKTGEITPV